MNPFRIISELIGRARQTFVSYFVNRRPWRSTVDRTKADYEFYDQARRGLSRGLEISGLFLKALSSKTASWVMGRPVQWKMDNPKQQEALNEWFQDNHSDVMFSFEECVALGDYFIVVNPDLTLTPVTPNLVDPIVADNDYGEIIGWRITQRFDHPTEIGRYMIEINEYYADRRLRWTEFENQSMREDSPEVFPNLIGRIPVIHMANNRMSNETYGQPEGAGLVATTKSVLHRYGEVLDAGLDGNLIQGRPMPVMKFNNTQDLIAFRQKYVDVESRQLEDGTTQNVDYFSFDPNQLLLVAGDFEFAQPGAFAGETEKLLSILYWIFLEYVEIPEFVMGTAIQGSRASADTQMPIFVRWIEKKRSQVRGWIMELAEVVAAMQALVTPGLRAMPSEGLNLVWEDLTDEDGQLTLSTLQWAFAEGLIDRETALQLSTIDVDDVQAVLKKAKEERDEARDEAMEQFERQLASGQGNEDEDEDGAVVDARKAA